jgi:CubicO group peptidase (beta-lactamase class C family)
MPAAATPLREDMQRTLQQEQLTGAVWATIGPDGVTTGAAGLSNASTGAPMQVDSKVQLGSVGKTVLAMGVLHLITEGKLSLDTPVASLLPSISFDNPWAGTDPVRIRHLLAHTSGLENFRLWHVFSLEAKAGTPLGTAFTRYGSALPIQARPGSRYAYCNIGYGLLGMVIETVTGQRYDDYLKQTLLLPLGMTDSTFSYTTQIGPGADPRLSMGHFEHGATQATVPSFLPSAGQFTATAADMARLAGFLMGQGDIGGRPFVAPALMAAIGHPDGTEAARAGLSIGHGLAMSGRDRNGVQGDCHPGVTIGFNAMLCIFPAQRKAFFVGTNTDSETAQYDRLNQLLIAALDLAPATPAAATTPPAADIAQWQGIYVPALHVMRSLAWADIVFNYLKVDWDGTALHVAPEKILTPTGGHLFRQEGRTANSHVLLIGDDGQRILSDGLHSYRRVSLPLFISLWASLIAGLLGLATILVRGGWRLLRRRLRPAQPMFTPLMGTLALALPAPLFFLQSFLSMGELTAASATLAAVTAALPLTLLAGLLLQWRSRQRAVGDSIAMLAALQCTLVLAAWGMLPLILWR